MLPSESTITQLTTRTSMDHFLSETLHLTKLPPFFHYGVYSFLFFLMVHQIVAPRLSARYMPNAWEKMSSRTKNNWYIHAVSQMHAMIVIPLALWSLNSPELEEDRAFGWSDKAGAAHIVACGYFLWDFLDSVVNFVDLGFVLHGFACFLIYTMSFRPFVAYYGVRCLLWESSTFFLNIHWVLDKTGRTGTILQIVNGCLLLATFASVRIVWGGIVSYNFFKTLHAAQGRVPLVLLIGYGSGNLLLQCLNYIWFVKMILALKKRMGPQKILLESEEDSSVEAGSNNTPTNRDDTIPYHD